MAHRLVFVVVSAAATLAFAPPIAAQNSDPRCTALEASGLKLPGNLDTEATCQRVLDEWRARKDVQTPPTRFDLTIENQAFADNLYSSLNKFGGRETIVVRLENLPSKITLSELKTGVAPDYSTGALGAILGAVSRSHNGVAETTDEQGFNLAPIVFEWVIMPLFQKLFKKDPLRAARKVDAVVIRYGASHPDESKIKRICFVKKGSVGAIEKKFFGGADQQEAIERAIAALCPNSF